MVRRRFLPSSFPTTLTPDVGTTKGRRRDCEPSIPGRGCRLSPILGLATPRADSSEGDPEAGQGQEHPDKAHFVGRSRVPPLPRLDRAEHNQASEEDQHSARYAKSDSHPHPTSQSAGRFSVQLSPSDRALTRRGRAEALPVSGPATPETS